MKVRSVSRFAVERETDTLDGFHSEQALLRGILDKTNSACVFMTGANLFLSLAVENGSMV